MTIFAIQLAEQIANQSQHKSDARTLTPLPFQTIIPKQFRSKLFSLSEFSQPSFFL